MAGTTIALLSFVTLIRHQKGAAHNEKVTSMRAKLHVTSWIAGVVLLGALSMAAPASAQNLSETEFHKLALAPKTAADHVKLAAYYRAHAAEHEADAKLHEQIAAAASKKRDDDSWETARDAAHYAEHSREAAEALLDLAKLHEGLAERTTPSK